MRGIADHAQVGRQWSCLTLKHPAERIRVPLTRSSIMRKWNIVAITAIVGLGSASFGGAYAAESLKVGFIYIGPIGDLGWTYQHDLGRKAMEKALGDKIETTYIENVPESADAERSIEQLVRTRHKLIFATSFGYMDPMLKIGKKIPEPVL